MIGDPIKYTTSEYPGESFEIEFLQDFADDLGISLDEYKEKFGVVEFKDEEQPPEEIDPYKRLGIDVDIDIEDAKTTAAVPGATAVTEQASALDADVVEENIVGAIEDKASTESSLVDLKSDLDFKLQEKNDYNKRKKELEIIIQQGGKAPELNARGYLNAEFYKKGEKIDKEIQKLGVNIEDIEFAQGQELKNLTDKTWQDPDIIDRLAVQPEDVIIEWLKDPEKGGLPELFVSETGSATNEINIPDFGVIKTGLFQNSEKTKEVLKKLKTYKDIRTDVDIRTTSVKSNIVDYIEYSSDQPYLKRIEGANGLLKDLSYQIKSDAPEASFITPNAGVPFQSTTTLVNTNFPDAPPLYVGDLKGLGEWFKNNITEEDFETTQKTAGKAQNTFMSLASAAIKQQAKEINLNQSVRREYFEEQFNIDLLDKLRSTKKFNKEEIDQVEKYFNSKNFQYGNSQNSFTKFLLGDSESQTFMSARAKVFDEKKNLIGLEESLRNKIINSVGENGTIPTQEGESLFIKNIITERATNIYQEEFKKLNPADQATVNMASRFIDTNKILLKDDNKAFNSQIQKQFDHLTKAGDEDMETLFKSHGDMFRVFKKYGVDFDIVNATGNLLFNTDVSQDGLTDEEKIELKSALETLPAFESTMANINFNFNHQKDALQNEVTKYYGDTFQDNKKIDTDLGEIVLTRGQVSDIADTEYDLGNLLINDLSNAFGQGATSLLALAGGKLEDYAIAEQKLIQSKKDLYEEMPEAELSLNYVLRTGAQQSFNLSMAAALGGVGALGVTTMSAGASMNLIAGGFGLTSVGQTKIDLKIQRDAAKTAIDQREKYRKALSAGKINQYDYAVAMRDINTTIAMGDLSDDQISKAAFANGAIEFLGTRFIGTAPNTLAMFKNLRGKVDTNALIKLAGTNNKLSKFYYAIGKPLAIRTGAEFVEEELIYSGNQLITDASILGRDIDGETFWKGFSETGWATLVIAGPTQTTSAMSGGVNAISTSNELKKVYSKNFSSQENLHKALADGNLSKDSDKFKAYITLLAQEMEAVGLEFDKQNIRLLNIGSEKGNQLMTASVLKMNILNKIGVTNDMTPAQSQQIISEHRKSLKGSELADFDNELQILDKTIKDIQDQAYKPKDYAKAKEYLGPLYDQYVEDARLNVQEGGTLNELVEIVNLIRKGFKNENYKIAYENPITRKYVESLTNKDGTKYTAKQRFEMYATIGAERIARTQLVAFDIATQADKLFKNIDNVEIIGWKNESELIDLLGKEGLKDSQLAEVSSALLEGKKFGTIVNGKIFSQNEKDYRDDLKKGQMRAGTMILHEFAHAKDDALMNKKGADTYYNNLFEAGQNSDNLNLRAQHDYALASVNEQFPDDAGKDFKNASQGYKDEYSKIFQEGVYANELGKFGLGLEKDKGFFEKTFLWDSPNNLNSPDKALNYMLDTNAAFRKGEITATDRKIIETSLNESKKSSTKPQVKNINELVIGKTYDQLKNDPEFRRQYDNVAVKAMKFDQELGNEINRQTVLGEAYVQLPSIIKNYKPVNEKGESQTFTNYVYQTLDPQKRTAAFYRKELGEIPTQKIGKMQLIGDEDADANIKRAAREKSEGLGKSLIKTTELRGVKNKLTEIDKAIGNITDIEFSDLLDSRSGEVDFAKINEEYGSKVAGALYGLNPKDAINLAKKFKKGADLTYGQNKREKGSKLISEAERIQSDYTSIPDAKEMISLFPEYNISTPTAITSKSGQETKTNELVQGRSLGTSPAVLDFFYEPYTDPKSLNKKTKKQAITNPSGRSKGKTSQVNVVRLKPEFNYKAGSITNAAVVRAQRKIGITKSGELNVPPKGKARTDFGRLLIGLANLKGAIVANTAVDTKVKKGIKEGKIKTAKSPLEIETNLKAGRSGIQFSTKPKQIIDAMQLSRILPKVTGNFKQLREVEFLFWNIKQGRKSDGTEKTMFNRNLPLPKKFLPKDIKEETVIEGASRIINDFLKTYPQYRNYFKQATVFGIDRSLYGVSELFNKYIAPVKEDQAIVNREAMTSAEQLTNKYVKEIETETKDYVARQKAKIKVMYDFAKAQEAYLKENKNNAWLFDEIRSQATNSQQSPYRTLFPVYLVEVDFNGKPLRGIRGTEEHSTPQNLIGTLLGKAAVDQNVDEVFPIVEALAMQGWVSNNVDNKLNEDFSKSMPYKLLGSAIKLYDEGKLTLPDGTLSAIRMSESGVDLSFQMYIPTGQTLSEIFFGTNFVKLDDQKRLMQDLFSGSKSQADVKKEAKILVDAQEKVDQVYKKDSKKVNTINRITDEAMSNARNSIKYSEKRRGISVFDFDDTLAQSNSNVLYTMPDGTTGSLTAGEFALEASGLTNLGAEFDFSEFNEVKDGRKGPLADVAIKRQGKFGSKDIFVLTARPQSSAINIKKFLDGIGLNIPLKNITGLENGTAEAKADWMIEKYADGYNDFYFADDAFKNVEAVRNVFDVLDVKSDVQQARVKFSSKLDTDFNLMIERNKGVKAEARYSDVLARRMGKNQDRFQFFLPPSAEDFRGLTMYTFAGKGKQGEADQKFFDKALIKPYMAGVNAMKISQQAIKNDYKALVREFPSVRKKLNKKLAGTKYTTDEAIRIFLWDKSGFEIPGLSKTDQKQIVSLIKDDANLLGFAEGVEVMTRKETYVAPTEFWDGSTIIGDLNRLAREVNRSEYLKEFNDNVDAIFNDKNYNKIEALYGFRTVEALKDIIYRMKTGSNRAAGGGRIVNAWNDWVNNSVGAIMFFNRRSALLQMLSAGNFVNWSDNNPLKAGLAFANQLQYWKDVAFLFNSDKLKARRSGLQSDINESEIAAAARKGGAEGALSYLLKIGFTPTQLADSFAISTGGATFYRNRINTYKNQGFTQGEAEIKAFSDFSAISDETQQSADPMLISGQQAGVLGRLVLAFQNTPMQYTRLMKKAGQDLINRRGDDKTNISKILYYGFIQNLIFSTLQNALFAMLPGADEEDPSKMTLKERVAYEERQEKIKDNKISRVGNNMIDTILRGSGLGGAVISTLKNIIREYNSRADMSMLSKSRANADMLIALTSISPPISSKVRKVNNALDIEEFDKDVIAERGYSVMIDDKFQLSPSYNMLGNVSSAFLNLPLDRVFDEVNSITEALDDRNTSIQRIALGLGWKTWDVGTTVEEHELIKTTAKEKRKESGIQKGKVTRALTKNYKAQVVTNLKEKYPDNWTTILREYILESGYKNINSLKIDDYVLLSKEYQVPIKPVDSLKISDINKKKVIKVKVDEYK